jgi:long-chain acyl-CoA synthetase
MTVRDERAAILTGLKGRDLTALLAANAREHSQAPALSWPVPGGWASCSWAEYAAAVGQAAAALVVAGVGRGDRVAVVAGNRPEHVIVDLAALTVGAVPVSVYPTLSAEQLGHVLVDSGAVIAVVADEAVRARVERATAGAAALRRVVVLEADGPGSWTEFLDEGAGTVPDGPPSGLEDPATIIYTSGTTGVPKGVVLTQANVLFLLGSLGRVTEFPPGYVNVSYLPLAHIAERIFSHYFGLVQYGHTYFCPDQTDLLATLASARPQAFLGVPRVWEKLRQGLTAALPGPVDELPAEALPVLRARIGLDRCTFAVSGAAPMAVDVLEFWGAVGLPIHEAYGMTETTGVTNINRPGDAVFGTVGPAIPGVEVRVLPDGEVVARGPNLMSGYLGRPDEVAIDSEGWLRTGDLGELSPDGRLRIVGRKKELIVTAGGKNVAPVPFEAALKEHPLVAHACLVGDRRPYLTALVVLDPEALARRTLNGPAEEDPELLAEVEQLVARTNERFSRVEQVKRYAVLSQDWTPDGGELTPTLKLRRQAIHTKYALVIEGLYD